MATEEEMDSLKINPDDIASVVSAISVFLFPLGLVCGLTLLSKIVRAILKAVDQSFDSNDIAERETESTGVIDNGRWIRRWIFRLSDEQRSLPITVLSDPFKYNSSRTIGTLRREGFATIGDLEYVHQIDESYFNGMRNFGSCSYHYLVNKLFELGFAVEADGVTRAKEVYIEDYQGLT